VEAEHSSVLYRIKPASFQIWPWP